MWEEQAAKHAKRTERATRLARFPFLKPRAGFDFSHQPSLDPKRLEELAACRGVANGENLVFLDPPA